MVSAALRKKETEVLGYNFKSKAANKFYSKFKFATWDCKCDKLGDIFRVKAKAALVNLFQKVKLIAGGSLSKKFVSSLTVTLVTLCKIAQTQGVKGLVLYLKVAAVILQQASAGHKVPDLTQIGPRVKRNLSGLPRIIPAYHRLIIINRRPGWEFLIRFYLTLFSIYRVIPLRGKVKLNTITDPGVGYDKKVWEPYIIPFIKLVFGKRRYDLIKYYNKAKLFPILRSSPIIQSLRKSIQFKPEFKRKEGYELDLWSTHPSALLESAKVLFLYQGGALYSRMRQLAETFFPRLDQFLDAMPIGLKRDGVVGKLSLKQEPAGKIRVFAMVDPFTQWLFAPLHKFLFSILRRLPMDGTFNQLRPIYRLIGMKGIPLYSLDLSAATDRLPVDLQVQLLNELDPAFAKKVDPLNKDIPYFQGYTRPTLLFGNVWKSILVDRDYLLPKGELFPEGPANLRYAVGQPMGALSSWAMLALTHHFIVQVAAWRAGHPCDKLFKNYAVLGDDLVIGDTDVKDQYLLILSELGVTCGLHKSLLSPKGIGLEFAKSTFVDGVNVSPISLKELSSALGDLGAFASFSRKWKLKWDRQARVLGFGYLARSKKVMKLNHALSLVYMTNFIKADFSSQILKSRPGAPKVYDTYVLTAFKALVVDKLRKNLERDYDRILDLNERRVIAKTPLLVKESDVKSWKLAWNVVYSSTMLDALADLSDCLALLDDLNQAGTFDEALALYLEINRKKMIPVIEQFDLNRVARPLESKLPYQARMFRQWTRLSASLVTASKELYEKEVYAHYAEFELTNSDYEWHNY